MNNFGKEMKVRIVTELFVFLVTEHGNEHLHMMNTDRFTTNMSWKI